jgi:hypothetical protein
MSGMGGGGGFSQAQSPGPFAGAMGQNIKQPMPGPGGMQQSMPQMGAPQMQPPQGGSYSALGAQRQMPGAPQMQPPQGGNFAGMQRQMPGAQGGYSGMGGGGLPPGFNPAMLQALMAHMGGQQGGGFGGGGMMQQGNPFAGGGAMSNMGAFMGQPQGAPQMQPPQGGNFAGMQRQMPSGGQQNPYLLTS